MLLFIIIFNSKKGDIPLNNETILALAFVYLFNYENQIVSFAATNNYGNYELDNINYGVYTLTADKCGFQEHKETVTVEESDPSIEVDIMLDKYITGIEEQTFLPELFLFPNPTFERAIININLIKPSVVMLKLFDLAGRQITNTMINEVSEGPNSFQLDLTGIESGVYIIEINVNNHRIYRKLVLYKY